MDYRDEELDEEEREPRCECCGEEGAVYCGDGVFCSGCPAGYACTCQRDTAIAAHLVRVQDGCCQLCNPVSLADEETDCVEVRYHVGRAVEVKPVHGTLTLCTLCVEALHGVAKSAPGSAVMISLSAEVVDTMEALSRGTVLR